MNEIDPTTAPEAFLAHSAWVRRLARRLLENDADAEDVSQDAWLVLRRQRAGTIRDLRAWLTGVVHRLAMRARERKASRIEIRVDDVPEALVPSTEQILDAESSRRSVVEAVLSLDEPYRSTLLLHFYQDLPAREIARRLSIPGSTVRTRVQRGLAQVREKLGGSDPRKRDAMHASLLLLVARTRPRLAPSWREIMLAGSSTKLAVGGVLVLSIGLGLWWFLPTSTPPSFPSVAALPSSRTGLQSGAGPREPDKQKTSLGAVDETRTGIASQAEPSDGRWHLAILRAQGSIRGTVIRSEDSLPVQGAAVRIATNVGDVAHNAPLADDRDPLERATTTDRDGAFHFDRLPTGPYQLRVVGSAGLEAEELVTASEDGSTFLVSLKPVSARRDRITSFRVRTEDETGHPAPGVAIHLAYRDRDGNELGRDLNSDANGVAECHDVDLRTGSLTAKTGDGRSAQAFVQAGVGPHNDWANSPEAERGSGPIYELVLRAPGSITGTIENGAGARIHAWLRMTANIGACWPEHQSVTCTADGAFEIRALTAGVYMITVDAPDGLRADLGFVHFGARNSPADLGPRFVEVKPGVVTPITIHLVQGAVVQGRVVESPTDTPVSGAVVRAWIGRGGNPDAGGTKCGDAYRWPLSWRTFFDEWPPSDCFETRTDEDGRYRLTGLSSSEPWVLEVAHPGLCRDFVDPLHIEDGKTLEIEHKLERAGGVQGLAWRWANIGFQRDGDARCAEIVTLPIAQGTTFTVTGLRPGQYKIVAVHWSDAARQVPMGEVAVRAGELTWVDLRRSAPNTRDVRLLHRGAPVVGATVDMETPADQFIRETTDADGRFTMRFPFASQDASILEVLASGIPGAVRNRFVVPGFVSADGPVQRTLELPEGEIEVEVTDARNVPLQATVVLDPVVDPSEVRFLRGDSDLKETLVRTQTTRRSTDGLGRVRFTTVQPGRFRLSAEINREWMLAPTRVEVAAQEASTIVLRAPETGSLRVHVVDGAGKGISGVELSIERGMDKRENLLSRTQVTDEHGDAHFQHVAIGHARVTGKIQHDADFMNWRWATGEVDIAPEERAETVLRFE